MYIFYCFVKQLKNNDKKNNIKIIFKKLWGFCILNNIKSFWKIKLE